MSARLVSSLVYPNRQYFFHNFKRLHSAVPVKPLEIVKTEQPIVKIDTKTIEHLERLSLVDFANQEGVRRLEAAIQFASQIHSVDTSNVDPLISVLQGEYLTVREDCVTEVGLREEILSNSAVTEEEYFYAPPGNIPLPDKDFTYKK